MRVSIGSIRNNCKRTKSLKLCIFMLGAISILVSSYRMIHQTETYSRKPVINEQKHEFRVIEQTSGVHTFSNVCIEELATPRLVSRAGMLGMTFNETKAIVIYGNNSKVDGSRITMNVSGSRHSRWNHWEIHFRQQVLPLGDNGFLRDTAFFIDTTWPGNVYHFLSDEFIPLHSVIALSNRLHPGARNQILYRTPQLKSDDDRTRSRRRFEGILRSLYIDDFHDVFYNLPNHTCFRHAVFGSKPLLSRKRDVVDHVLRYYNLTKHNNRNDSDLYVTLLERKFRRIINADEVLSFVKEVGFKNVRIVDFTGKSILYQLEIMQTSNVFIGVQGAGLQWSVFMPEGSYVIEYAWPQKHWPFYFKVVTTPFGIRWRGVAVKDVRVNWTSYATRVRHGVQVDDAEKPKLIKSHPMCCGDNIWKWCDIYVQKNETFETFKNAYKGIQQIQQQSIDYENHVNISFSK